MIMIVISVFAKIMSVMRQTERLLKVRMTLKVKLAVNRLEQPVQVSYNGVCCRSEVGVPAL